MGGSFTKQFGKLTTKVVDPFGISKPLRKIIDPLNIMDPLNVLPTSGDKWLTADKNFGAPLMNWLNPKQSSYTPMTKGLPSNAQYFQQQQQMLQNMQAQQQIKQAQQQSKLANLRSQAPSYPAATQTTTAQVPASSSASATAPSTATLAQTKSSDTASASDLPMEFGYKPPTKDLKVASANTFSLPNMSDIKFGGA
jgi:type II secretory pathway pseudopilin PulG